MNAVTYVLIAFSLVAGSLAVAALVAIKGSERHHSIRARSRLESVSVLLQDEKLVGPLRTQSVESSEVEGIERALNDWEGTRQEIAERRLESERRSQALGSRWLKVVRQEEERGARPAWPPQEPISAEEIRYMLLRDALLSLLDDLPLEQVLLERDAREQFDEVLELIPPSPSQARSAH